MAATTIPPEGPRYAPITSTNRSGALWIAGLLSVVYSVLSLLARMYIKRAKWWYDDTVCVVATILGVGSFVSLCVGLSNKLGRSASLVDVSELNHTGKTIFASQILLISALTGAKSCVILLMKRCLALDMYTKRRVCDIINALVVLWGVASIVGIVVQCAPTQMLTGNGGCSKQFLRWEIIGIFDGTTEILIVLLSTMVVWGLNLETSKRIRVVISFTFRLLLIPVIALHIYLLKATFEEDADTPLLITTVLVLEQVELGYSLITATVPNLKAFIQSFDTTLMMTVGHKLEKYGPVSASSSSGPPQLPNPVPYVDDHPLNSLYEQSFSQSATTSRMPSAKSRHAPIRPPRSSANFNLQNEHYTGLIPTHNSIRPGGADDSPTADTSFKTYATGDTDSISKVHEENWPLRQLGETTHTRQDSTTNSQDHPFLSSPPQRGSGWVI